MTTLLRGYDAWITRGPDLDDGPCSAQSPDGRFICSLNGEHKATIDHATLAPVEKYAQASESDADHLGCKVGDWIASSSYGGEAYVTIASWPQREDDFDDDGNPAERKRPAGTP